MRQFTLACLIALGLFQLGGAAWIHAKAVFAQILIAHAWEAGPGTRPWPWADTWPVARLRLPGEAGSLLVLQGPGGHALAFGPARLGDSRIIAGHRDTHFRGLELVQLEDVLALETRENGSQHYRVNSIDIVDSSREPLHAATDQLTLVTCYPFAAVDAGGPLRYVVRADPVFL